MIGYTGLKIRRQLIKLPQPPIHRSDKVLVLLQLAPATRVLGPAMSSHCRRRGYALMQVP